MVQDDVEGEGAPLRGLPGRTRLVFTAVSVPDAVVVVVCAIAGLVVGGYATTLTPRVLDDENVLRPLGRCPHCHAELRLSEMVPVVSWLTRRGRCRTCDKPYGARYPITELVTALAFALMAVRFGADPLLPAYLYVTAVGVVLAGTDLAAKRLPDVLTLPSYFAVAGLLAIAVPHEPDGPRRFVQALIGMAVLTAIYFLLFVINPRGMAWGDVKLSGVLGLALGWFGQSTFIVGAFCGFLAGAVVGLGLVLARRAKLKSAIPFGPFMIFGALLGILIGDAVPITLV